MTATRLANRAIVRISPTAPEENVRDFAQGLVTNDVSGALPIYAGLLTPQGKTLFDFIVWGDGDDLLLDCEAEAAEDLVRRLSLYRLRRKIVIAVDPDLAVHWQRSSDGHQGDPRLADLGRRWLAPANGADQSVDKQWVRHRLALGVPEGRAELGDILWLETNAAELGGVSFNKGCYVGQENTARMNWRQKVNRRLMVVPLDRSDEKRRKHSWPEYGYAIDHMRAEDIDPALAPGWMRGVLSPAD